MIQVFNTELRDNNNAFEQVQTSPDVVWQNIIRNINGTLYIVGASKVTTPADSSQASDYEFLFVDAQPDGQVDSRYYKMKAAGNFTDTRGLASFNVDYIVNVGGRDIPCKADIRVNSGELLDVQNIIINPTITPAVDSVSPAVCMPNTNDLQNMIAEFCSLNNINQNIVDRESTADYTPGR